MDRRLSGGQLWFFKCYLAGAPPIFSPLLLLCSGLASARYIGSVWQGLKFCSDALQTHLTTGNTSSHSAITLQFAMQFFYMAAKQKIFLSSNSTTRNCTEFGLKYVSTVWNCKSNLRRKIIPCAAHLNIKKSLGILHKNFKNTQHHELEKLPH